MICNAIKRLQRFGKIKYVKMNQLFKSSFFQFYSIFSKCCLWLFYYKADNEMKVVSSDLKQILLSYIFISHLTVLLCTLQVRLPYPKWLPWWLSYWASTLRMNVMSWVCSYIILNENLATSPSPDAWTEYRMVYSMSALSGKSGNVHVRWFSLQTKFSFDICVLLYSHLPGTASTTYLKLVILAYKMKLKFARKFPDLQQKRVVYLTAAYWLSYLAHQSCWVFVSTRKFIKHFQILHIDELVLWCILRDL